MKWYRIICLPQSIISNAFHFYIWLISIHQAGSYRCNRPQLILSDSIVNLTQKCAIPYKSTSGTTLGELGKQSQLTCTSPLFMKDGSGGKKVDANFLLQLFFPRVNSNLVHFLKHLVVFCDIPGNLESASWIKILVCWIILTTLSPKTPFLSDSWITFPCVTCTAADFSSSVQGIPD